MSADSSPASPAATAGKALSSAKRHAALRWAGAPLLLSGIGLLLSALAAFATGGSGLTVALSFFGTGMGLASFGANHDAAIAYLVQADGEALPKPLRAELDEELDRDRAGTLALRPVPVVAALLPLVAAGVQGLVAYRLFFA